ncbi:MAG: class I SAM-dependent methyltransferase [Pseudomonadota bacterium]
MTTNAAFWDRAARKYAASPVRNPGAYEATLERVRTYLSPQDRVLETGCGTGTTALKLAGHVAEYVATDVSAEMIAIAREKQPGQDAGTVTFVVEDDLAFDRAQDGFDAVMNFNLMHLVPDLDKTVRRAGELLRPGGLFISKTPCLGDGAWFFRPLIWALRQVGIAPPVRILTVAELEEAIRDAGFEMVETGDYPAKPPSHFVVARKLQ